MLGAGGFIRWAAIGFVSCSLTLLAAGSAVAGDSGRAHVAQLGGSLLGGGNEAAPAAGTPVMPPAKGEKKAGKAGTAKPAETAPAPESTVFTGEPPAPPAAAPAEAAPGEKAAAKEAAKEDKAGEEHAALFKESDFPSAVQCGECHPKQFREWSVSQHAYAEVSVVFHAFQHAINVRMNGSNGDFCARCHSNTAGFLNESADSAVLERHPVSRESISCIVCHRVSNAYNKVSGRMGMHPGDITQPVYGPTNDNELKRVLSDPKFHVQTDPEKAGQHIHRDIIHFAPIRTSTFCGSCHDVTLFNGFRLEEAFSEYRTSPAAARGVTCQDCHMGKIGGKVSGYEFGPAATIDGKPTTPRRLTNHIFSGPDYPIVHPGVFPFDKKAQDLANVNEWTEFDYKAGWGTDAFEKNIPPGYKFPPHWQSVDDRYDAQKIIQEHLKLLEYHKQKRLEVLRNGYGIGEIRTESASPDGLAFAVEVKNLTDGHNVPTGFTEERAAWLDVTVTDPAGRVVFRSGDRDRNGDLRDQHSQMVRDGLVPLDDQLFNLQARVLLRNLRGGEQLAVVPIPYPQTALPYIRPSTFSQILLGRPMVVRNQKFSIEPLGHRIAEYRVDGRALRGPGPYHVSIKMMNQTVPVNLLMATQYVGFDYNMSPKTVAENVVNGAVVVAERQFDINVR